MIMIRLDGVSKVFQVEDIETRALDHVSLEIHRGEFVAIMGPSGCGKSTLLNILGLLDNPTMGSYSLDGENVSSYSEHERVLLRRGRIGFVFQNFNLMDELNVYENIELPLLYLSLPVHEQKKRISAVAKKMQITHRLKHYPSQLSGGQQQRVAIARALVINPDLILADEPTGNLDSKNGAEVIQLLKDLNNTGSTVVMVTHSERAASCANRIINLFDGRILLDN